MNHIFQPFKIIVLATILSFGLSYALAWTAPSATPPTGNVSAPINTGDNTQYKAGNLVLNDSATPFVNGLIVRYGKVGIGVSAPTAKLDVLASGGVPLRITNDIYDNWVIQKRRSDDSQLFGIKESNSNGSMSLITNDFVRMTIVPNGNVGIGTTVSGAKLSVAGTVVSQRGMYLNGQVDCTGGISFGATNYVCNTPYITTTLGLTGAVGRYPYTADDNLGEMSMKGVCGATGGKINGASATFAGTWSTIYSMGNNSGTAWASTNGVQMLTATCAY